MGGKMKLRRVMVVAPMRSRMAPKSGRERASSNMRAITVVLKITRVMQNAEVGRALIQVRKLQHDLTLRYFEEPLEELIWRVHQNGEGSDEVEEEQDLHRHLDRAVAQGVDHTAVYADQQIKYVKQSLMQNL